MYHEFYRYFQFLAKHFDRNYGSATQDCMDVVDRQMGISVHILKEIWM